LGDHGVLDDVFGEIAGVQGRVEDRAHQQQRADVFCFALLGVGVNEE
jgi:hypothetical protein